MKKQFQSKAVPRGTRTIWRYLGALFLLFTFAIGQMRGESATITIGSSTSTSYAATFTSSSTNTHVTANATSFTKGSGVSTSNSTYDKATAPYSVKYKPSSNLNTSTYSDANSISAQFTVATGYTFAPSAISATIVTEAADYTYQAVLTDGTTTYTSSDVSSSAGGKSTFSFTSLSGKALSGTVTFKIWYKSTASNKKFFVVNLPITITGTVTASGGGGGGNVDPEFTYTPATYILGSVDPLDLSTKLTSTNTTGAITFAIKDAAGTGASIANSKNFTATTAGTAKVTVTQAASTGYNAKSQDIDVTVAAPMTYHAISGTQEMYGLYTQIFNKTTSVASAYSSWVSSTGTMSGSGSSYTAPEGWLSGASNQPGYGYFSMTNAQTVKFYVTNCTKVEFLQKAGGSSRSMTLSVKKNDIEVSSVKQENGLDGALVYSGLTATDNYVVTITGSDGNTNRAYQMRFTAGELPDATKYTVGVTGNNPCVAGGESATITLSGSQSGVSYQLYKDNAAVEGKVVAGTGSAISFAGIEVAGTYTVKSVASATYKETAMTGSAAVTLAESPVITTQPTASQKVAVNAPISLSVATSTEGVSYQWYSTTDPTNPATEMAGKNAATLNITSAATATTMYYYCVISKSGMCSVESELATVITKTGCETETLATSTITGATTDTHSGCSTNIKLQDANGKLNSGAYFEMSLNGGFKAGDVVIANVKANDMESGKLYMVYGTHESYAGYQVQNGPTEGNTANVEFVIPSDMATIGFIRTTTTSDGDKSQNHEIKSVTVKRETCYCVKPTIGTQPAAAAICTGSTATLTVGNITGGATPYTYAWYNGDGTAVSGGSGATTASYTTAALAANASYYCVVSTADGCSAQSNTVAVTIKAATAITTQPVDADASIGIAREFSVVATGAGTLEYQWQIKNGENWDDIANADEATYSVSKDAAGDYKFRCVVSGDCGDDVISNVVTLSVAADVLTVTYNANGGTCETSSATWTEGDDALVLPTATKANFDFIGWYDAATGGNKIASPYTPSASIELFAHYMPKLVQAIYSNSFDAFIKNQAVNVYYLQGESVPALSSIKVLGQDAPAFEEVDGNIKVTIETVDYIFPVTKTAVAPHTGTGTKENFDGTETYVKSGYSFSTDNNKYGWRFSKTDDNWSRETPGNTRIYFFLGAAQSIALENGGTARDMKVYRNGVELTTPTSSGSATIAGTNAPAMYAIVSNQDGGDGAFKSITITPWVPVESIVLKEGTTAISNKEIAEGAQFTLTAEVTPANASNPTIVWESENADIASVAGGVVTGEAFGGPVNIIARSQDDNTIYATCAVTVAAPCTPSTIAWNVQPADGVKGGNGSASVTTNYAAGLEVVSSDPTVASVSNDGVNITINYLKKGTTKITATVVGDGSIYCNTPVSVEKTITVSPDCPVSGNLFTWAIDPEANNVVYNVSKNSDEVEVVTTEDVVTVTGGNVYLGTTASNSTFTITSGAIKIRENGNNYIKVVLECALQAGDVLSYTSDNSDNRYMSIKKNNEGTAVTTSTDGKHKYVLDSESPLIGAEVLYMTGSNGDNSFKTFRIDRMAPVTGVSLANATVAIGNTVTPTMTLLPSNEAYYESIAWSIIGEGKGTIANIDATTGVVTALAAGTVTVQVKLNNSESLKATCQVEVVASFEQVDVTESTVWDMTNVSANAINLKDDYNPSKQNVRLLLANINGVNNNSSFNSQALMFEGQHIGRTSNNVKHLAGRYVQFNITVPGAVIVTFASNGSSNRTIRINDKKYVAGSDGENDYKTFATVVEPGSVEIIGYEGESANQYVRISKIEFKAEDSYHRTVNPSYLGTLCWTNNAVLGGATLYEFKGKNENNYLVFDEVPENRLEAGKPYIFMPENGNTEIKLYNTDDAEPLTTNQAHVNHMYGTIVDTDLYPTTDVNMYYFSSNHIWAVKDFTVEKITVPAYYCYVDYPAVLAGEPAAAPAPGRRRVTMGVQGEQVVTGINAIEASEKPMKLLINGQLFIIRGEKMFNANGQLVK